MWLQFVACVLEFVGLVGDLLVSFVVDRGLCLLARTTCLVLYDVCGF